MTNKKTVKRSHVLKQKEFLHLLANTANKKRRCYLIKTISPHEIKAVDEIVRNLLSNKYVQLSKPTLKKLQPNKEALRAYNQPGQTQKQKKKILNQTGGSFLKILLPIALQALSKVIGIK